MIIFPLKFLLDDKHPPHDSKMMYRLKFYTLLSVEIWIYIAAVYQDKKYNYTDEVLYGDSSGNLVAKDVVQVRQMIIVPFVKTCVFLSW